MTRATEKNTKYWRSRAKVVVDKFEKLEPILINRRGAFSFDEWNEIQEIMKLTGI